MPRATSDQARQGVVDAYHRLLNRDPSEWEISQAIPQFQGDWNGAETGNAYVANIAASEQAQKENNPTAIYARQQAQWQKDAPNHYDQIGQLIKSTYGRDATQDELSHYGTLIASGQADPYQIQQFLQSTPEYQNAQDKNFRSGLNDELQGYDDKYFNRTKNDVIQKYAQMGRATSPALDVALTDLASQISERRGQFLSQLSAQQYGGNKTAAMGDYASTKNDITGRINQSVQDQYDTGNQFRQRQWGAQDYAQQQSDWSGWSGHNQPKPGWMDYLNTAFNGINAGAKAYTAGAG